MRRAVACLFLLVPTAAFAQSSDRMDLLVLRTAGGERRPITDAAGWAKRRAEILKNMQEVMGPLPDVTKKVPFNTKSVSYGDYGTYVRMKFLISVEEGDRLPVYVLAPKNRKQKLPA